MSKLLVWSSAAIVTAFVLVQPVRTAEARSGYEGGQNPVYTVVFVGANGRRPVTAGGRPVNDWRESSSLPEKGSFVQLDEEARPTGIRVAKVE
ncbi:hypothetical protein B7486_77715, partial [cyanobacterium TDX16]